MEKITFVSSDIVDSTGIKKGNPLKDITRTFNAYHIFLKKMIECWSGEIWNECGDGINFFFRNEGSELKGFSCALAIMNNLKSFNLCESEINKEIKVRISMGTLTLELNHQDYGKIIHPEIDKICKFQKSIASENQIVILESTYQDIPMKIRKLLFKKIEDGNVLYIFECNFSSEQKIFQENMLGLSKIEHSKSKEKDIPINISISQELNFVVLVDLANLNQKFTIYYNFSTDRGENLWIGYSKQEKDSQPYIMKNENTQIINIQNSTNIFFIENIYNTIRKRFPMIQGTPNRIVKVRVRADDDFTMPVIFYFGFFEKKY